MKTNRKSLLFFLSIAVPGLICLAVWHNLSARASQSDGRKARCYQDSMHPWIKSDQPGKCTICAMDLTPIYEGEKGFGVGNNIVALSSNSITVLNVQTEEVKCQPLIRALRVAGTLEANETRKTIISAPAPCRILSTLVKYAGVEVEEGQSLLTLFSPELVQKRGYFRTSAVSQGIKVADASQATQGFDFYSGSLVAPQAGVVVERNAYSGQYVPEGEKLFTIVDPSVLWFRFDVYERQLPWLEEGQAIEVTVEAVPGKKFPAAISFIEPTLGDATRTVKARADIKNPIVSNNGLKQRLLRFGMYAEGRARIEIPDVLTIPRTAILFPGGAAYAYVDKGDGAYEKRRVDLGRQGDDLWEVLDGVEEGDRVVTSGNVLIDAQAQFNQGTQPELAADTEDGIPAEVEAGLSHPQSADHPAGASIMGKEEKSAPDKPLTQAQWQAMTDFLSVASGISQALAADSLDQLKKHTDKLPDAVSALAREFDGKHPWSDTVKRVVATAQWPAQTDLAAARKAFLPFSASTVELVQLLRGHEKSFRSLKVYHCPMAPKPGLWFQVKGPLRNPFYGSEMLTCGDEVKSTAAAKRAPPGKDAAPEAPAAPTGSVKASKDAEAAIVSGEDSGKARMALARSQEMRKTRQATITGVSGQKISPGLEEVPAMVSPTAAVKESKDAQAAIKGVQAYRDSDKSRMALSKEMRAAQKDAIAKGNVRDAEKGPSLTTDQRQTLEAFIAGADDVRRALAEDNLDQFNKHAARLSTTQALLQKEIVPPHPWGGMIQSLPDLAEMGAAEDLTEARDLFLMFSAVMAELAQKLRKADPAFAGLRIYECSVDSEPALWMQIKGPLANPFYGAKMPACGQEIVPEQEAMPPTTAPTVSAPDPEKAQTPIKREQTRQEKLKARAILKDDMWQQRSEAIAKAKAQKSSSVASSNSGRPSAELQSDSDMRVTAAKEGAQAYSGASKKLTYNEMDKARMAIRDDMKKERSVLIAQTSGNAATDAVPLTTSQRQALETCMAEASSISQALAADDLDQFNKHAARIPAAMLVLRKELAAPHQWAGLVQSLTSLGEGKPAKDLKEARGRFLPYSTAMVELARQLRKADPTFAVLKIYHCPMAPKPGLWIQAKEPLANPFFGAEMLTCGKEVKQ